MIARLSWGAFTIAATAVGVVQAVGVAGGNLGPFASPIALLVEHMFITGLGAWGLWELINHGKRMASREDLTKLRDDVSALLGDYQLRVDERLQDVTRRMDHLVERRTPPAGAA